MIHDLFISQKIKMPRIPPNIFKKISYHVKERSGRIILKEWRNDVGFKEGKV